MREIALCFLRLHLSFIGGEVRGVTDIRTRVQPVVRADGNCHQTKGSERTQGGQ